MKQSLLTALSAVLAKSAILRPVFGDHLRNGLARFSKSAWLALNPRTSLEVFQLFTSPELRPVLRREPRLMFKFLRDYLATDLSRGGARLAAAPSLPVPQGALRRPLLRDDRRQPARALSAGRGAGAFTASGSGSRERRSAKAI
jgi:hypothetical protein